jgi:hypothetical protein
MSTRIGSGQSFSSALASRFYWNGSTGNVLRPKLLKNRHVRCCLLVFPQEERAVVPPTEGSAKELVFAMKKNVWRAAIEVGFIIFLFYSNLLMGEFERSGIGQKKGVPGQSQMFLPLPILELPWSPRSSVIASLNSFERNSRRMRL